MSSHHELSQYHRILASAHEVLRPFRLVVTDGRTWFEALGQMGTVTLQAHVLSEPIMRSSSGLGDQVVEGPRQSLFESMFAAQDRPLAEIQDDFHASRIANHDEQSVDMLREDARTVSTAVITATDTEVTMVYNPGAPRDKLSSTRSALTRFDITGAA